MTGRVLVVGIVALALLALPILVPVERLAGSETEGDPLPRQLCAIASLYAGPTARIARLHLEGGNGDTAAILVGRIRRLKRLCGPELKLPPGFGRLERAVPRTVGRFSLGSDQA